MATSRSEPGCPNAFMKWERAEVSAVWAVTPAGSAVIKSRLASAVRAGHNPRFELQPHQLRRCARVHRNADPHELAATHRPGAGPRGWTIAPHGAHIA
jgi:hypothetical protein